jgi:hypothetical protein
MKRIILLMWLCIAPGWSQTPAGAVADEMLAWVRGVQWGRPYSAMQKKPGSCSQRVPIQLDIYATVQWTHHCNESSGGLIRESFYYVFGEPPRTAELRVDVRPEEESPAATAGLLQALRRKLTDRFGNPDHAPELMEIGFRHLRYGEPVAGDHWKSGSLHYFLHANQSNLSPLGMRRGVQLVVLDDRLMKERGKDERILEVEGFGGGAPPENDPVQAQLNRELGANYARSIGFEWKTPPECGQGARLADRELTVLLRDAEHASREGRALRLLAADALVSKLSGLLVESPPGGEREAEQARSVRQELARSGVKLGHMTHYGGLEYRNDLLWRVWKEFPDTAAGEMAFVELQRRGWNTDPNEGCPKNPDLFREVIAKGEVFLAQRLQSRYRQETLYVLAVANESWWSIAHAPADDPIVSAPPYPRRALNARQSAAARERAIQYYREVVRLAPESAEAASALRRLPRLELGLDTGQRRFFCSYC